MWPRTICINKRFCTDVLWKQGIYLFWFQEVSCWKRLSKRTPAEDTKAFRNSIMNFACLWIYLSKPLLFPFRRRGNNNKYRTKQLNLYSEHFNTWKVKCKKKESLWSQTYWLLLLLFFIENEWWMAHKDLQDIYITAINI